jgi:hypothetical protein
MSVSGVVLMEEHMSIAVKVPADTPGGAGTSRQQPYLWTTVLILGVIAACAIGASFHVDAPLVDASMVAP